MLKMVLTMLLLVGQIAVSQAATSPRVIDWEDLVPRFAIMEDPLAGFGDDVRDDLSYIARVRSDIALGFSRENSERAQKAQALVRSYAESDINVDALLRAVERTNAAYVTRQQQVVAALDGQLVRLPGYALPLELAEAGVTEFLLVPYVGACIHTPPPPPNQMVLIGLEDAYRVKNLFDAVWVTGTIRIEHASRPLYLVDGQADIAFGYSLNAISIEPYD